MNFPVPGGSFSGRSGRAGANLTACYRIDDNGQECLAEPQIPFFCCFASLSEADSFEPNWRFTWQENAGIRAAGSRRCQVKALRGSPIGLLAILQFLLGLLQDATQTADRARRGADLGMDQS